MRFAVVVLAGGFGCYAPTFQDCELACGTGASCPTGQSCIGGMCRDDGLSGPCSVVEIDAPLIDAPPSQWGPPEQVPGIGPGYGSPTLHGDQRTMYVARNGDVLVSRLPLAATVWSVPDVLAEFTVDVYSPEVSFDGRTMHVTQLVGTSADIFVAKRAASTGAFGGLAAVAALNTTSNEFGGSMNDGGMVLVLASNRAVSSNSDLYLTSVGVPTSVWRPPVSINALNDSAADEFQPALDGSGLRVAFSSNRAGNQDIYIASRPDLLSDFGPPQPIAEVNTSAEETDPWLSPDGRTLYFVRGPTSQILRSIRP